jgi:hypothetical protein
MLLSVARIKNSSLCLLRGIMKLQSHDKAPASNKQTLHDLESIVVRAANAIHSRFWTIYLSPNSRSPMLVAVEFFVIGEFVFPTW